MKKLLKILLAFCNIACVAAMLSTAYAATLNAGEHPRFVIASMSFPVWLWGALLLLVLDFFMLRRWCLLISASVAISLPLALNVMPLNIKGGQPPAAAQSQAWTLMSYNVSNFQDLTGSYAGDINPAISFILKEKPDVAVLPEGRWLTVVPSFHLFEKQLDSIYNEYPTVIVGMDITLLSKFPAKEVPLKSFPNQQFGKSSAHSKAGCFIVDIFGHPTAIVGVHLKSLGLTREDKNIYEDFTRGEGLTSRSELTEARIDIIGKISNANIERARQIDALINDIDTLDIENIIVCGDFNDTPGCYSLRQLVDDGFREVYPLVGNGYTYTYNSDRLLFRIDHILTRGYWRPWSLERGNLRTSDHYPLTVTFIPYPLP